MTSRKKKTSTTAGSPAVSSSTRTDKSSSSDKILRLGDTIAKELGYRGESTTLTRWMAFRIAELLNEVERAKSVRKKDQLTTECTDLILKIWSMRDHLPHSPTKSTTDLFSRLDRLLAPKSFGNVSHEKSYLDLLQTLDIIESRKSRILIDAEIASGTFSKEINLFKKHRSNLSEEEVQQFEFLVERLDGLKKPDHPLASTLKSSKKERQKKVVELLKSISSDRSVAIGEWQKPVEQQKRKLLPKSRKTSGDKGAKKRSTRASKKR